METESQMIIQHQELVNEIRKMRADLSKVSVFIKELKQDYEVLDEKVELNSSDVMRLLGVSRSTLGRWRESNVIPYRYISSNHVVYPFKGLYIAVKTGRATFKVFRRIDAIQRLNAYKDGIIKGYLGEEEPEMLFEEL